MNTEQFVNSSGESFNNPTSELEVKNIEIETLKTKILLLEKENDQLRVDHLIDSLTGCYNRNFFEKFKNENFNYERDDNNIALVFIDLNHLKETNDKEGHDAGDKLIKNTANYLKSIFRKDDLVIRFGGDEFVVLCRNYKEEENFESGLANKIKEKRKLDREKDKSARYLDFAFGVAAYNQTRDLNGIEDTQKIADERMYQDKKEIKSEEEEKNSENRVSFIETQSL